VVSRGYFTVGRIRRIPLRVHIATPVGLFVYTGFSFDVVAWAAVLFVILIHELGHAAMVRRYRLPVVSIDVNGIGGVCIWGGHATAVQESVIAWGGVLAQCGLLVLMEFVAKVVVFRGNSVGGRFFQTLVQVNFILILLNLLPFPPLDGAKAWALFRWRDLYVRARRAVLKVRASVIQAKLKRVRR
jgi:Zn-dependent protease